ncbi:MAG: heme NO-binding domain-containing protein [Pseudomonadales bacterium]|nr:heme NO-binding domain-containing protein [Pseudomonadales bacterium]
MLGIVFTEFFELVEDSFGADMLDDIIADAQLANDGAYTAVGQYDHGELLVLVTALGKRLSMPVPGLVRAFGQHLFRRFTERYSEFFEVPVNSIELLSQIENHIHVEVKKLYPQASLPTFSHVQVQPNELVLEYQSSKPFADLAEGLIEGCADHFSERVEIQRQDHEAGDGYHSTFTLRYS